MSITIQEYNLQRLKEAHDKLRNLKSFSPVDFGKSKEEIVEQSSKLLLGLQEECERLKIKDEGVINLIRSLNDSIGFYELDMKLEPEELDGVCSFHQAFGTKPF